MSNLSYFILTDQEQTIISQTHVDWFGYGIEAFIEYAPVAFIITFPFILVIGILMRRAELDQDKENPDIKQPKPSIFKMISRVLVSSLILSIFGTVLATGAISYQKVVVAQSYAGVRQPAEEDTENKLRKHGFNPQDFMQVNERTETYDIVPGTLKKKAENGEYTEEDKEPHDTWVAYKADIIVGYVGNEPKIKEYEWDSSDPSDPEYTPIKYVKSSTPGQKPTLKVTYNRVEDTRFRSVPSAVDGDCWSVSSNIFYFDPDTVPQSCEYRKRVEAIFPVD